jgi:peptidoglycan/xylan/chitin deacetylase (PgdA/CDA1 family)
LLLRFLRGEARLPPNPVMVTFDDGYRDNREHALPILRRHGIPGLFFVSSGYVDRRRLFWWDRIRYLVRHATVAVARMGYPTDLVLPVEADPAGVTRAVLRLVKTCHGLDLERFLDELGRALGVPWDGALERRLADAHVMTWDDVRALHAAGMGIGSHTRTHRVLDTLDPSALRDELVGSRLDIERAIRARVSAISYPVGRPIRGLPLLERAVRTAGYDVGFAVEDRANPLVRLARDPFNVARRSLDGATSRHGLAALLAAPELSGAG